MFLAWTKENHIWSTFLAFTKLKEDIPPWHRLKCFSYFFANFRVNMLYSTAPSKKQHFKLKIRIEVPQSFCTKLQASNFFIFENTPPYCSFAEHNRAGGPVFVCVLYYKNQWKSIPCSQAFSNKYSKNAKKWLTRRGSLIGYQAVLSIG